MSNQLAELAGKPSDDVLADLSSALTTPFTPTPSAVRVNVLWFISLVLSVSVALGATMVKQWTTTYTHNIEREVVNEMQARMAIFYRNGLDRWHVGLISDGLPTLLHISVFFFFAGLIDFMSQIHTVVMACIASCVAIFGAAYLVFTILPVLFSDCVFGTPLTAPSRLVLYMVPIVNQRLCWWLYAVRRIVLDHPHAAAILERSLPRGFPSPKESIIASEYCWKLAMRGYKMIISREQGDHTDEWRAPHPANNLSDEECWGVIGPANDLFIRAFDEAHAEATGTPDHSISHDSALVAKAICSYEPGVCDRDLPEDITGASASRIKQSRQEISEKFIERLYSPNEPLSPSLYHSAKIVAHHCLPRSHDDDDYFLMSSWCLLVMAFDPSNHTQKFFDLCQKLVAPRCRQWPHSRDEDTPPTPRLFLAAHILLLQCCITRSRGRRHDEFVSIESPVTVETWLCRLLICITERLSTAARLCTDTEQTSLTDDATAEQIVHGILNCAFLTVGARFEVWEILRNHWKPSRINTWAIARALDNLITDGHSGAQLQEEKDTMVHYLMEHDIPDSGAEPGPIVLPRSRITIHEPPRGVFSQATFFPPPNPLPVDFTHAASEHSNPAVLNHALTPPDFMRNNEAIPCPTIESPSAPSAERLIVAVDHSPRAAPIPTDSLHSDAAAASAQGANTLEHSPTALEIDAPASREVGESSATIVDMGLLDAEPSSSAAFSAADRPGVLSGDPEDVV